MHHWRIVIAIKYLALVTRKQSTHWQYFPQTWGNSDSSLVSFHGLAQSSFCWQIEYLKWSEKVWIWDVDICLEEVFSWGSFFLHALYCTKLLFDYSPFTCRSATSSQSYNNKNIETTSCYTMADGNSGPNSTSLIYICRIFGSGIKTRIMMLTGCGGTCKLGHKTRLLLLVTGLLLYLVIGALVFQALEERGERDEITELRNARAEFAQKINVSG